MSHIDKISMEGMQSITDRPQMRLKHIIKNGQQGMVFVQYSPSLTAPYDSTDMSIDCRNCSLVLSDNAHDDALACFGLMQANKSNTSWSNSTCNFSI